MYKLSRLKIKDFLSFEEQVYEFRDGEAILIIGDNQDQLSQKGNGAGKSALIEAIAVAISGKPLRKCLTSELILKDKPFAEISLELSNAVFNHTFAIKRAIYANTTPAVYEAKIDNVDQGKYYADWNQFNSWVFKTIGISKDDFFGNYLVTEDNYKPFLRLGDTEKKEFVNRFSGANVVDKVFPSIEADASKVTLELEAVNKEIIQNRAKQEVFADQIQELRDEVDPEKVKEEIAELEREILCEKTNKGALTNDRADLNKSILKAEKDIKQFKYTKDFEAQISQQTALNDQKAIEVKTLTSSLSGVKEKFAPKATIINKAEAKLKEEKAEVQENLSEYEDFESEINKHLQDAITCPECKHVFCLRDEEYDVEKAQALLPGVVEAIAGYKNDLLRINKELNSGIQEKRSALNQEVTKAQQKINDQIGSINTEIASIADLKRKLKQEKDQEDDQKRTLDQELLSKQRFLKNLNNDILDIDTSIAKHQQEILSLQELSIDQKRLNDLTKSVDKLIKEEETLKNQSELKRKEKERLDTWELNFMKFKSHLANKSIKNIQDYTNVFLEAMGSDLSIVMSGYRPLANKKKIKEEITTRVNRNGFDMGSYGMFSGGERGRIDISVILTNQELINLNCAPGKGLSFLGIDEILDQMDGLGLELLIDSLQYLNKTIMIVSQQVNINNVNNHTLVIRKKGGVSQII